MIDEMHVQNLALIRDASLEPCAGLTVLTGETGAGKTALLSAMKLVMGARADKGAVREGSDGARVQARFVRMPGAGAGASERADAAGDGLEDGDGLEGGDGELVVTRALSADGRSRATANGTMASAGELAALAGARIDLCSQNEHQQLMKPANHVGLLDAWIGAPAAAALEAYRTAYESAQAAAAELDRVLRAGREGTAALDEARFVLQRIDAVDPQPGEYDELAEALSRAEHAESLARAAQGAHEALMGENGALDALNAAIAALQEGARFDAALSEHARQLIDAGYVLEDVSREVRAYGDRVEFDPATLEFQQQRMADMQGLLRTYGPTMEDVLAARDHAADTVSLTDDAELREREARTALAAAEAALAQAAEALAAMRSSRAQEFAAAVTAQMRRLEMGDAALDVRCDGLPREHWTRTGSQAVEFMFRPGAAMQSRPFARIASGGETSRVMLALKVVLGQADRVETLVFDEIDAGVGGSAANALAEVLADLARTHQVIVITHLAQVAVRGAAHYKVEKQLGDGGVPETRLRLLAADERPREIARMLSGDVTEASLGHARELLAHAGA